MKFTVIIPTLNAESQLHTTLESLSCQTYDDFECLIMDGGSTDATVGIVKKYQSHIPALRYFSEKDAGIYDAMNKGVTLSQGEYIFFLGAGDSLHNNLVLETVSKHLMAQDVDILYGNILLLPDQLLKHPEKLTNSYFRSGKMICHQSIFARKSTLTDYPFSLSYTYASDKDWLIHCLKSHKSFAYIPETIANYDTKGISSNIKNRKALWMESGKILRNHYGFLMLPVTFLKYYLVIKWS